MKDGFPDTFQVMGNFWVVRDIEPQYIPLLGSVAIQEAAALLLSPLLQRWMMHQLEILGVNLRFPPLQY